MCRRPRPFAGYRPPGLSRAVSTDKLLLLGFLSFKTSGDFLAYCMGNAHDEGVAHAKGTACVAHAVGCPTLGEALELVKLIGYQATVAPVNFDDVFEA